MAYTLTTKWGDPLPIRLLVIDRNGIVVPGAEFTPTWWTCDPCNHSSKRFTVEFAHHETEYAWYQVITSDDDDRAIKCKCEFYSQVLAAQQAVVDAKNALHKLVG